MSSSHGQLEIRTESKYCRVENLQCCYQCELEFMIKYGPFPVHFFLYTSSVSILVQSSHAQLCLCI